VTDLTRSDMSPPDKRCIRQRLQRRIQTMKSTDRSLPCLNELEVHTALS
jgi:hypothetical protein